MDGTQCGTWSKRTWPQKRQTVLPGRQAGPCPSPQTSETGVPNFGTRPALSCNDAPCSRSRGSQQPASAAQQGDARLVSALAPARAERGRAPLRCRPCRSRGLPCRTSRTSVRKQSPNYAVRTNFTLGIRPPKCHPCQSDFQHERCDKSRPDHNQEI